jgi:hypothetical protein
MYTKPSKKNNFKLKAIEINSVFKIIIIERFMREYIT